MFDYCLQNYLQMIRSIWTIVADVWTIVAAPYKLMSDGDFSKVFLNNFAKYAGSE